MVRPTKKQKRMQAMVEMMRKAKEAKKAERERQAIAAETASETAPKRGRPKKYATAEEAKAAQKLMSKMRYQKEKNQSKLDVSISGTTTQQTP